MMFDFFKRKGPEKPVRKTVEKPIKTRRFAGAAVTPNNKFLVSYSKINAELRSDLIALVLRARQLVKNNETVAAYINLMLRSVLGHQGLKLNATVYNEDGTSDIGANSAIENHWYEYTHSHEKLVSADGQMNGLDFDRQVLFCYLVDGEVFIRKVKDPQSKYGIRFEVLDSLQIDTLYNVESKGGFRVCMGIKIDDHYRPVSYFLRKDTSADYYTAGERIEVPASEIIHVYKKLFPLQVRGYTPLAPVILTLNSLEQYKSAEINASILNSAFMGIWTKQSAGGDAYGDFDREDVDESGDVAIELESNVFRYAPEGYTLQQINNNHPTDHLGVFLKSLLKGVAGALGMSFNKISSDYESTSYSSLRASALEDETAVKELQQFLIDNWKDLQFAQWLKYLLISDMTHLPYTKIDKFLSHDFQGRNFEYIDPSKELQAIQTRLALGLSSPIEEIEQLGKDPEDVINSIVRWRKMLNDRGLKLGDNLTLLPGIDEGPEDKDETEEN